MLTSWILALMIAMQPEAPWKDTYPATAAAIDLAVREQPSLFTDDEDGRAKTAAILVALAWAESTFKPNAVGAGGTSGLFQIAGRGNLTDPTKAASVALTMVRESFALCRARPVEERLAIYAAGGSSCKDMPARVLEKSRFRVWKGLSTYRKHPPPSADAGAP